MLNDDLYKEFILELNRNPMHKKELTNFDIEKKAINKSCGDDIKIQIKLDAKEEVADIAHQGQGCAISQAAVSLLLDDVLGKNINEILEYDEKKMIAIFGMDIMYSRKKCMLIGLDALLGGLKNYKK